VNTIMNLWFHKILGSSWVVAQLAASQEGLSSMSEWVIVFSEGLLFYYFIHYHHSTSFYALWILNVSSSVLMQNV
jgi:hypothetical protein